MIILASASPRRKELLGTFVGSFDVMPADIDETPLALELPKEYVARVAKEKAFSIADKLNIDSNAIIIASDTSVVIDGEILGKPDDIDESKRMLRLLANRSHDVMTSLCICDSRLQRVVTDVVTTNVEFRNISDVEIELYWRTGEPIDKAGSYAIQGIGASFVKSMSGSYSAVVGLPLFETAKRLNEFGVQIFQENNDE
ncbi:septum formation inhibitor Maf [Marinomonas mediterranea]|uniref:Maf family protein n=1 Tax=Marinomonas mediterranea TaxID=119864 RepID=UPI00234A2CC6|nr:Maf family protein [Marinomonas mediterranea]WCN13091.1 septum formation inhibitor Maf [Marinomonas mediterranea]